MQEPILTVSQITREIKSLLENSLPAVWVQGEISNFTQHSSGHSYFTMKDNEAQISCVMWKWKSQRLFFSLNNGMKVVVKGKITVYEKNGQYQLNVDELHPAGEGDLQLAYEQMKKRLSEEGLFDESKKKPLPYFPEKIGIITSPTGAALQDMVTVLQKRLPSVKLILAPVLVQGDGARDEIVRAIEDFNDYQDVDLLIIGRGGGSIEDLWAFNEEIVARAISDSRIPVISAVGHEIDFTIADFVADVRALTPSSAAEMAVPNREELVSLLFGFKNSLKSITKTKLDRSKQKLNELKIRYGFKKPEDYLMQSTQKLDELSRYLNLSIRRYFEDNSKKIDSYKRHLEAVNPEAILKRGYSITHRLPNNEIVISEDQVNNGDGINVRLHKGNINATVTK